MSLISIVIKCPAQNAGTILDAVNDLLAKGVSVNTQISTETANSKEEEFKNIRKKLELNQEDFGKEIGNVSQAFISDVENGKRKVPNDLLQASRDLLKREENKIRK